MRLLLDTNVWSRLADWNLEEHFYRYIKSSSVDVVIAPATLMELLKSPHKSSRQKRIKLACRSRWTRLPTEAKSESDEVVAEIRRLHPEWLRESYDLARLARLNNLWGYVKWQEARIDEYYLVAEANSSYRAEKDMMVSMQREQQQAWRNAGYLRFHNEITRAIRQLPLYIPAPAQEKRLAAQGWRQGESIEMWRTQTHLTLMSVLLKDPLHTYFEWIGIYIDINALRKNYRAFGEMLLHEVDVATMKRNWIRWAVEFGQHAMRIGPGNPMDSQLSSYLFDADLFLTIDGRFVRILDEIRQASPSSFAKVMNLRADENAFVEEIEECVASTL